MPARQWSCVALNVKELLYKRHIYVQVTVRLKRIVSEARHAGAPVELCRAQCEGAALQETHLRAVAQIFFVLFQVTLFVNGYECETVTLPVQGILVRKVTPTNVLIGHACPGGAGAGAYHLAGVHVYRAPVLSTYCALHITAHGPDHACQHLLRAAHHCTRPRPRLPGMLHSATIAYHLAGVHVYRAPVLSTYCALHITAHGPDHACQHLLRAAHHRARPRPRLPGMLHSATIAYHLAGVHVYRAPVLSTYCALHITAHGPDHACQHLLRAAHHRARPRPRLPGMLHSATIAYHLAGVHVYRAPVLSTYCALHITAHGPDHACQHLLRAAHHRARPRPRLPGMLHSATIAYHLAGVHVYRAPVLSTYCALHITAHGPDHACQVRCESPNFPLLLTPNVLDSNIDWDQVFEISSSTLREMHDNLLLTFSASAPNIMNLYHQTVALPTVFAGRVASTASLMSASASGLPSSGSGPVSSIPETLFTKWNGSPLASRHRGVTPAVYMLGGPDILLYLYARVVELEGSAAEQALALSILLRACRVDNRLHAMLYAPDAPDMLLTVLAAPKCIVSHHTLKVILDEACSTPLLSACGESVQLATRTDAVLLQPELLVLITNAWRYLDTEEELSWEVESSNGTRSVQRGSAWALALCAVRALLRDQHPRRAFNHYQMNRTGLLNHLLLACKERFLNSECGPLDAVASSALVEVVRGLVGAPPLLHRLALLCDFLLLMHQASDTFVTHSRANFYFLLTSETQEMSEFSSSFTKRRTSKRVKKKVEEPSVSSTSTEEVLNDNSLNSLKDKAPSLDDRIDSSCGSTESTKQMKSLINTQIKEGRKHTASSTSENSDTPVADSTAVKEDSPGVGASAGEGSAAPPELNEYIVVDSDDVNHTTVEMYTSGIYHQRRVRAGAAAGWSACEGLLLLLRHALALLPDHAHHQAISGAVCAENLVVLSNQRHGRARAAAVRALAALTRRATPDMARKLHHQHYYIHLANQISLYEGSWELASACAALLTKCDVPLEDQLDDDIWVDVTEESLHRSPPLLALLPCCLADVPLAHNITLLARRIIDKVTHSHRAGTTLHVTEESPPLLALLPCCLADVPLAHNITLLARRIIDKVTHSHRAGTTLHVTEESPPLLALLPCCLADVPLAHNITLLARRIIDKVTHSHRAGTTLHVTEESPPLLALLPCCLADVPLAHNITLLARRIIDKVTHSHRAGTTLHVTEESPPLLALLPCCLADVPLAHNITLLARRIIDKVTHSHRAGTTLHVTEESPPLLALLPCCLADVPLAHNITLLARRIIDKVTHSHRAGTTLHVTEESPPLLALLPCCLADVPLAHNITLLARRIIDKVTHSHRAGTTLHVTEESPPLLALLPCCLADVPLAHNITLLARRIIDKVTHSHRAGTTLHVTEESPPLLALLPCCLADVPLAHNITLLARRIIDKASLKVLSEISLVEAVVRSIRAVGQMADTTFEGRELLLEDLYELLNRVAVKALSAQHSMQTISELHHMLTYIEVSGDARVARVARDAQLSLYNAQLDHLEDKLHSSYNAHTKQNYFTTGEYYYTYSEV
ncbi:hypothetical protein PYW07_002508 [Mythimna separata]|uniref:Uncharacterized protein n=1 Tax=Mythimna separata TaxID=271217 RepID=A0AAD8DTC6_MYTSE|nr:hypothetical protein PYW07_002508 [Mythimna separata]